MVWTKDYRKINHSNTTYYSTSIIKAVRNILWFIWKMKFCVFLKKNIKLFFLYTNFKKYFELLNIFECWNKLNILKLQFRASILLPTSNIKQNIFFLLIPVSEVYILYLHVEIHEVPSSIWTYFHILFCCCHKVINIR